jgi:CheY-like chemotaxis protein
MPVFPTERGGMSRKRIFLAADEQLLPALSAPLRRAGLSVETFNRQSELVPAVRIDPPDALLLSARLPDGSALAAFLSLGASPPPTVVVLAQSQLSLRPDLLKAGVRDVVISPIKPKLLSAKMAEVAGGIKRADARDRVAVPIVLEFKEQKIGGVTIDISREGLGLSLWEPVPEGSVVGVTLTNKTGSLQVWGRVLHVRRDGERTQAGVRLLGLVPEEEATLLRFARPVSE